MKKILLKFSHGPLLIILAASLWAFDGVIRRDLYHIPPVTIVFYEHLIGLIILIPICLKIFKKETLSKKTWFIASLVALFGGLLGTLFITTALVKIHFISFSVVFLIQKLQPIFAMVSAYFLLGEKITRKYLGWAVLAIIAVFFVTFPNGVINFQSNQANIEAALYALGAAVAWGLSTTFSKLLLNQISTEAATAIRFFLSTIFAFIAVYFLNQQSSLIILKTPDFIRLIFIAFSTGLFAMWLYYKGLKITQAKISTILELTLPLLAVFIDVFLYKNFLAPSQYFAAIILMFAIYQVSLLKPESTSK